MVFQALAACAAFGRWWLVAGLFAGLLLPGLAARLLPWLPYIVGLLLVLTAWRIGPKKAMGSLGDMRTALILIAIFQLAVPLTLLGFASLTGWATTAAGLAVVLAVSAPAVSGAANFSILLGREPAPALRLLVIGTALFPLTVLPVFLLLPGLGPVSEVLLASGRLLLVIVIAATLGFGGHILCTPDAQSMQTLDGASVITLAVVVVALMAAIGPAARSEPLVLAAWLALAFAVNFGLQIATYLISRRRLPEPVPVSIVAGNRNIALFLVALPDYVTAPMLIFVGCWQVPMFLTPVLLRRFYA